MLLKCSPSEKRSKVNVNSKQLRGTGNMKLTVGAPTAPRLHRKVIKGFSNKRPIGGQPRMLPVTGREEHKSVDASDNSNDSGLGFDHHLDFTPTAQPTLRFSDQESLWASEHPEVKRKKLEIKLESDDTNDNYSFPETMNRLRKDSSEAGGSENAHPNVLRVVERRGPECLSSGRSASMQRPSAALQRSQVRPQPRPTSAMARRPATTTALGSQFPGATRDGKAQLQILCQPEQQHRARYQTEGSRGAVKDRSGNGFPVVKLVGYNKPATLQVYIGTDIGRIAPHMFYQACRVSGKNSTPCLEKKIDGTVVIEVNFEPAKDMIITCDCVGILKERNVDVEHRFPDQTGSRNKKKSTRCRMVFRTTVTHPDGSTEVLQITSQPIVCTQPPGIPEICKKSLVSSPCTGGLELFILGKNFLKDTHVIFQHNDLDPVWEESVLPDKEFLQQTHLVCTVPPYRSCDLVEPVVVRLFVMSSGKTSEPHTFTYTPTSSSLLQSTVGSTDIPQSCLTLAQPPMTPGGVELERVFVKSSLVPSPGLMVPSVSLKASSVMSDLQSQFLSPESTQDGEKKEVVPIRLWTSSALLDSKLDEKRCRENETNGVVGHKMMHPPPALLPIGRRASAARIIIPDSDPNGIAAGLKTELVDESSQSASQLSPEDLKGIDLRMKPASSVQPIATVTDLISTQSPSMATFRRFVSSSNDSPLPAQSGLSVENYLSHLEKTDALTVTSSSLSGGNKFQISAVVSDQKGLSPSFSASSLMFQAAQQTASTSGREVRLPNIFSSEPSVDMEKGTLQEAIAASFVAGLRSEAQQKSDYGTTSVSQPLPSSVLALNSTLPTVTESQINNFPSVTDSNATSSPLNVSTMINNIVGHTEIIQTAASLMFNDTQAITSKSMMSPQKSDGQLMDSLTKTGDQLTNIHDAPTRQSPSSINIEESSTAVSQHLLSVSQGGSTMMSVSPASSLDALVSSSIENHILASDATVTQKLNALVNSAAESHLINQCSLHITSKNSDLNSQTVLSNQDTNGQSPPVCIQNLQLESSVSPGNDFHLNSGSSSQEPVQISQDSMLNNHILVSGTDVKMSPVPSVNSMGMDMNGATTDTNPHLLLRNPTSPIAMKTMILNSTTTSVENQILAQSPTRTSPIAIKNLVLHSPSMETDLHLPSPNHTSPIAMKSIIVTSASGDESIHVSSPTTSAPVAVNSMLNSSSISDDIHLPTSPIAMKKLILESTALVNELNAANSNPHPSTTILSSQVPSMLATTVAETSSVHMQSNILASSSNELLNSSTVPTPLANSLPMQQGSLVITQAPSVPSSCSTTSITPATAQGVEELQQHITSIFATNNTESVGFAATTNPIQSPNCTSPMVQGEHLNSATCFTTAGSNSQNLLANTCMSSNAENQNDGSARFVNQVFMGLTTGGGMKTQMETPMITETTVPKTIQGPDFLTSSNKVSDSGTSLQSNLPQLLTKYDVAAAQENTSLPVPVAEISSGIPTAKVVTAPNSTTVTTPAVQKKCEEGMVPQELTQMSENDLLSYINPSCFDQV